VRLAAVGWYIYAFVGNAGWRGHVVLLGLGKEGHEFVDCRHGNVPSIISRQQRLALEVQEEDSRRHSAGIPVATVRVSLIRVRFRVLATIKAS
jgi:hypothetical protein